MPATPAFILQPADLWLPILIIAAWLVISCLKAIGQEVDRITRRNRLQSEAKALRQIQTQRLRALGVKTH